jgi:hypothetical protein
MWRTAVTTNADAIEFDGILRSAERPFVSLICGFLGASNAAHDRIAIRTPSLRNDHTMVERCFIGSVGGHQSPFQGWRRMQSPLA